MAVGWSPLGSYSDEILKSMPPSDFSGRAGRWGTQGRSFRRTSPLFSSRSSTSAVAAAPVTPRASCTVPPPSALPSRVGAGSKRACGASEKPLPRVASRSATAAGARASFRAGFSRAARCSSSGTRSGRPALGAAPRRGGLAAGASATGLAAALGRPGLRAGASIVSASAVGRLFGMQGIWGRGSGLGSREPSRPLSSSSALRSVKARVNCGKP